MFSSYKIATVWGIPIRLHISLLIMVVFLAQNFGLLAGIFLEAGLALSIVLHELGHSLVAIKKGCRVREITLMFLGGAARMERIPTRPMDEFLMAIAGPAVSAALGALLLVIGPRLPLPHLRVLNVNGIELLGYINLSLAVFNLLPSFPMDGGRVLRAGLTPRFGRVRATYYAARLGQLMAILFGLYGFLAEPTRWLLIAIGFFVYSAAAAEYRQVVMEDRLRRGPFGFGMFTGTPPPIDDEVVISPSPYSNREPPARAPLESHEDDPFRFRP